MTSLHSIRARLTALAGHLPKAVHVPRLAIILDGDPNADERRRAAEAVGDPLLEITLFNHDERNPTCE